MCSRHRRKGERQPCRQHSSNQQRAAIAHLAPPIPVRLPVGVIIAAVCVLAAAPPPPLLRWLLLADGLPLLRSSPGRATRAPRLVPSVPIHGPCLLLVAFLCCSRACWGGGGRLRRLLLRSGGGGERRHQDGPHCLVVAHRLPQGNVWAQVASCARLPA